jgi:hypothetical protein
MGYSSVVLNIMFFFTGISKSEGYFCPYTELGFDGSNDLIYDYYDTFDDGITWQRIGQIGWVSRESYCGNKKDIYKCSDSVNKCVWSQDICIANIEADSDCFDICKEVLAGNGPSCLGGETCVDRNSFYSICNSKTTTPTSQPTTIYNYGKCKVR